MFSPCIPNTLRLVPIIAGGVGALVKAQPNTEDSFQQGYDSFAEHIDASSTSTIAIGVTCGLSSSFVRGCLFASQVAAGNPCYLLGFTHEKDAVINLDIEPHGRPYVINPIVGPEPIAGSVRMKGGSATLILLTAILNDLVTGYPVEEYLEECAALLNFPDDVLSLVSGVIAKAGEAIRGGHSLLYHGSGVNGTLGVYDAAECPPTFGARDEQVKGRLGDGFSGLKYYPFERADTVKWAESILSLDCKKGDVCVVLGEATEGALSHIERATAGNIVNLLGHRGAIKEHLQDHTLRGHMAAVARSTMAVHRDAMFCAMVIRICLTHISTGAFIQGGKIYKNTMIDLRITNRKLWLRACRLVATFSGKDVEVCQRALVQAVFVSNPKIVSPGQVELTDLIATAARCENVVPRAILSVLFPTLGPNEIARMIQREPRIRKLIQSSCQN